MRPDIVICDEPTSALDVSVQAQILNQLLDLRRDLELTYLLITHDLAVVEHMATRVAVMYLGRIVELADAAAIFRAPQHPYTKALLGSILTPDPTLDLPDMQLGAGFPNPVDPPSGCSFPPALPVRHAPLPGARARQPRHRAGDGRLPSVRAGGRRRRGRPVRVTPLSRRRPRRGGRSPAPSVRSSKPAGTSRPLSVKARRTASTLPSSTRRRLSRTKALDAWSMSVEPWKRGATWRANSS